MSAVSEVYPSIAGRTVMVTGGSRGLGREMVLALAEARAAVAVVGSRPGTALDDTVADANRLGAGRAVAMTADVSDYAQCEAAAVAVLDTLGPIDVLIYNADVKQFGPIEDISTEQFELSWRASVLGLYASAKTLAPGMIERGTGTIVVSGATASLRGAVWTTALAPAKAAQRVLSQSLAKQLGPKGIHVCYIIIDGVIDTAETREHFAPNEPDEFFISPERIAETALMLTRQDRSAWTFELDLRPFGEKW